MKKLSFLFLLFLGIITQSFCAPESLTYRLGRQDNDTIRFVLETPFNPSYKYNCDNDVKINIDQKKEYALKSSTQNLDFIKSVKYTKLPSINRITIDANCEVEISKHFVLPKDSKNKNYRIVFDIKKKSSKTEQPKTITKNDETPSNVPIITSDQTQKKRDEKIVVIDAGHGGKDPGAIGKGGTYEKNITLSTAKLLEKELIKKGYTVYLTRKTDVFLQLQQRRQIAVEKKAGLFISIHADSHPKSQTKGLSIYTISDTASDIESARLAERENAADLMDLSLSKHYDKKVVSLLSDLKIKQTKEESIIFSKLVLEKVSNDKSISLLDMKQRFAPFAVLKSHIPSVLVELGYLSNRGEEKKLKDSNYQKKLAKKIADSVASYPFIQD